MRALVLAILAVAAIGLATATHTSAAPANGVAIGIAADEGLLSETVHCRRYPHRHRGGVPHGWGFGCAKKEPVRKGKGKGKGDS